jgi:hypothetical protein
MNIFLSRKKIMSPEQSVTGQKRGPDIRDRSECYFLVQGHSEPSRSTHKKSY